MIALSAVKGVEEVKREREREENKNPVVPNVNASRLNEIMELPSGSHFSKRSSNMDQLMRMDGELIPDNYENPRVGAGVAPNKSQNKLTNPTPKMRRRQLGEGGLVASNLNVAQGSGISQSRGLAHKKQTRKTQLNANANNIGVETSQ